MPEHPYYAAGRVVRTRPPLATEVTIDFGQVPITAAWSTSEEAYMRDIITTQAHFYREPPAPAPAPAPAPTESGLEKATVPNRPISLKEEFFSREKP